LARAAIRVSMVLLGIWLGVELAWVLALRPRYEHAFEYDAVAAVAMVVVLVVAHWLLRRGRTVAIGYLLALTYFVYPLLNAVFAPQDIYLVNIIFLISVLVAGTLLGRGPAYLFAGLAIAANIASWLYARNQPAALVQAFDPTTGFIFILGQTVTNLAIAAVSGYFSEYVRQSVAKLNTQAEQMSELAHTDPLTGLANRRWLMEQLDREFARARRYRRPLSLLYLDVDAFKGINDRFGHLFGDEVLTGSTRAMKAVLRSADLLARVGGDEFAVLLPETTLTGALEVGKKLRRALAAYGQQLGPAVPPLTFCAGAAQLHEDDATIDDILARADEAQYLAKATGKAHTRAEYELSRAPDAGEAAPASEAERGPRP
jgi:diguanylate cyclase (GGDEF)-like protein